MLTKIGQKLLSIVEINFIYYKKKFKNLSEFWKAYLYSFLFKYYFIKCYSFSYNHKIGKYKSLEN